MKRPLAIFASVLASSLLLTGCGASANASKSSSSETSTTPTVSDTKQSFMDVMSLTCGSRSLADSYPHKPESEGNWEDVVQLAGTVTVDTLEEAWNLDPAQREYCVAPIRGSKITSSSLTITFSSAEIGSAQASGWLAGKDGDDPETLQHALYLLYGQCASYNAEVEAEGTRFVAEHAEFLLEDLCPNHPEKQQALALLEENEKHWDGVQKERAEEAEAEVEEQEAEEKQQKEIDDKTIEPGTYLVGDDVKPGTYVAKVSESFENCYWEVADKNGNIINNEWAIEGKSMVAIIPKSAYTFKNSGCGNFIKQ